MTKKNWTNPQIMDLSLTETKGISCTVSTFDGTSNGYTCHHVTQGGPWYGFDGKCKYYTANTTGYGGTCSYGVVVEGPANS